MQTAHQKRIEEFMKKAEQDVPVKPTVPSLEVRKLRAKLIFEEAMETIQALGIDCELVFTEQTVSVVGAVLDDQVQFVEYGEPDLIEIADGCADISVVTVGTLSACGIHDQPLLEEVDKSNLAKFGPGGRKREDGKWLKPDDWQPPDIVAVLARQTGPDGRLGRKVRATYQGEDLEGKVIGIDPAPFQRARGEWLIIDVPNRRDRITVMEAAVTFLD